MRKRVITLLVLTLAVLSVGFVIGASADYVEEINDAFNCLDDRVASSSINLEEAVFSMFADVPDQKVNQTINQQKSSSAECWPSTSCTVKATAQVALAKLRQGENVDAITDWLKTKTGVVPDLTWYLQVTIDNNEPASCVVNYDDVDYNIAIDEDMVVSGNPGGCLAIDPSGYRLRIASSCLEKQFNTQCDKGFKTNLLYTKSGGDVIYVSSQTHGAAAGAWTLEEISAKCFKDTTSCTYEGSLWAATALFANGEEISTYSPYLRALASDNERYFPSAFLVTIQGGDEHYGKIIDSARYRPEGGYWEMPLSPYGKYYDTALAMWALGGADTPEIENTNTLSYLFNHQDTTGCWDGGNVRDTAFLIFSALWLRGEGGGSGGVCGDGVCTESETSESCPEDCPLPVHVCGDGVVGGVEACDGGNLTGKNCTTVDGGFDGGNLYCVPNGQENECTFDTSACTVDVPFEPVCGDSMVNGSEVCDCGSDQICGTADDVVGSETCQDRGEYDGGNLMCGTDCLTFNVSGCYVSGDFPDLLDGDECTEDGNCSSGEVCEGGYCVSNETGGGGGPYDPNTLQDCELSGFYCTTDWACFDAGQTPLPDSTHACENPTKICCPVEPITATCDSMGGTVCPGDARCTVLTEEASDGPCCIGGECGGGSTGCLTASDCDINQICNDEGVCVDSTTFECENDDDCLDGEVCSGGFCTTSSTSDDGGGNMWIWIIILAILIILVVLGIIYRDKLKMWWHQFRSKSKGSKVKPGSPPPGAFGGRRPPPRFGPSPGMRRPMPGRALFMRPGARPQPARPAINNDKKEKTAKEKEEEETLRKLKEMSK